LDAIPGNLSDLAIVEVVKPLRSHIRVVETRCFHGLPRAGRPKERFRGGRERRRGAEGN
jgi:hypothetical protein